MRCVALADFFEKFRATCLEHSGLNDVRYYIAPGLAWDAALRMSRVSLELITDVDMYHFVENSIRCGISTITTRYARANVPTLPAYDATLPNMNLVYLDANNLYRWTMAQPLPTHGFRFLHQDEIEALEKLTFDAEDGYIFEVDLSYSYHLHDSHDEYPLAPESLEVGRDMYSPAQRAVFPDTAPQWKLTRNLRDKVKYVVHSHETQENLRKRVNVELIIDAGILRKRVPKEITAEETASLIV